MKDKMKEEDKKAFNQNVKALKYILTHKELDTILSPGQQKVVKEAFKIQHKQLASNVFDKEATGKEKSTVKEALNIILSVVMNQGMNPILSDLGKEFGLLAFNWNKAFGKRPDIAETSVFIKNLIEGTLSLIQAIGVIKKLMIQVKEMEQSAPPAFNLARHYLKTFQKKGNSK